jgi:hypothetical protein
LCKRVVPLEERRNAAWDERFDHIARHFEREKRSIDEWICAEENQPKKILLEEKMKRDFFDDEDEREKEGDVDAAGDDDDAPQPQPQPPVDMPGMSTPKPPVVDVAPGAGQKRPHSEDSTFEDREAKRRQTMTGWRRYCVSFSDFGRISSTNKHSAPVNALAVLWMLFAPVASIKCAATAAWKEWKLSTC